MADFDQAESVDISSTTIMKIVKHCRSKGSDETIGVIMGTCIESVCYVGNSFPYYRVESSSRAGKSKTKKTVVDKAAEFFTKSNYDNILCGVYVNVPEGQLFSSEFFKTLLDSHKNLINDAKIVIVYENSSANVGLNPFKVYKLSPKFVHSVKAKKVKEIVQHRQIFDELPLKLFRSSPDQAFLAEYVCPDLPNYDGIADEDISISSLCNSYLKTLEDQFSSFADETKNYEYENRKIIRGTKSGKVKDIPDSDKLEFIKNVDALSQKISDAIGINLEKLSG
jgi:hypothetical protein